MELPQLKIQRENSIALRCESCKHKNDIFNLIQKNFPEIDFSEGKIIKTIIYCEKCKELLVDMEGVEVKM